jgi:hypothetical protein
MNSQWLEKVSISFRWREFLATDICLREGQEEPGFGMVWETHLSNRSYRHLLWDGSESMFEAAPKEKAPWFSCKVQTRLADTCAKGCRSWLGRVHDLQLSFRRRLDPLWRIRL